MESLDEDEEHEESRDDDSVCCLIFSEIYITLIMAAKITKIMAYR